MKYLEIFLFEKTTICGLLWRNVLFKYGTVRSILAEKIKSQGANFLITKNMIIQFSYS